MQGAAVEHVPCQLVPSKCLEIKCRPLLVLSSFVHRTSKSVHDCVCQLFEVGEVAEAHESIDPC